jgi:hypothetical protein
MTLTEDFTNFETVEKAFAAIQEAYDKGYRGTCRSTGIFIR